MPLTADSVTTVTEAVDDQTEHDPIAAPDEAAPDGVTTSTSDDDANGVAGIPNDTTDADAAVAEIDIAGIEADLDGVHAALGRLADGTYWTDEVTGEPIPADVLAADPSARRA